ncbi:MAG TPA: class I SAM-dependent methyltransferase [Kineosporiaceae bacterium]
MPTTQPPPNPSTLHLTGIDRDAGGASDQRARAAQAWIIRWDRQQERFLPEREAQFTALVDAVEEVSGRPDPLVVDLGCGPGCLSIRVLDRLPGSAVVAIDADPILLELGRRAFAHIPGLRFVDADLRHSDWADRLALPRRADAVVSTTALHWLEPAALTHVYARARALLRPDGVLLNGDEMERDRSTSPVLSRLDRALVTREQRRRSTDVAAEEWHTWWREVTADPDLADAVAERDRRGYDGQHHVDLSSSFQLHLDALRAAGFGEVGPIWQRGENRLMCAVNAAG